MRTYTAVAFLTMIQAFPCLVLGANGSQESLGIPASIARVVDSFTTDRRSMPEIILIQDVHKHPEVQGHIAAILLYGTHHWDLKDVYAEGSDENEETAVVRTTRPTQECTGLELAARYDPNSSLSFHGLENAELYRQHVAAYQRVQEVREAALRELDTNRLFLSGLDASSTDRSTEETALLKRVLRLRLKPSDYTALKAHEPTAREGSYLRIALESAKDFYTLADARSHFFTDVLAKHQGQGPAVAVVGGFHTAQMAEALKQRGMTYVVLSPQVTETGYDEAYSRGMEQTISALQLR